MEKIKMVRALQIPAESTLIAGTQASVLCAPVTKRNLMEIHILAVQSVSMTNIVIQSKLYFFTP